MKNNNTKKLAACAVMVALGAVLSLIKVLQMPFGGSITLLSMLPCAMISIMYGLKWGFAASFVESVIQLAFGITMDGILGWGMTPSALIGTILLDYIVAYTVIGIAGISARRVMWAFAAARRWLLRCALCATSFPAPLSLQTSMSLWRSALPGWATRGFTPSAITALTCCRSSSSQLSRRLFCSVCRR